MKNVKKILAVVLSLMTAAYNAALPVNAAQNENSPSPEKTSEVQTETVHDVDDTTRILETGDCGIRGDNVQYELHLSGNLYIFGNGIMNNFDNGSGENISPFWNNWRIKNVIIESGVNNIGENVFDLCLNLKNVEIANTVRSIEPYAFIHCEGLENIKLSENLEYIGFSAFFDCINLVGIDFPDSLQSIGDHALDNCMALTNVVIPDSVNDLGYAAFYYCSSLEKVKLSSNITKLQTWVFANCEKLNNVIIPDSVTTIEYGAFEGCVGLERVEIPVSVTQIEDLALSSYVRDVYYTGSEEEWNAINCEEYNLYGDDTVIHYNSHLIEYGDVNGDAVISAKDSMQAQRYAIKLDELTPAQINAADVDKDGKVTSKDALYILRCSINLAVLPIEN